MSAFVIGENDKQQALLYTAQNSRLNKKTYLQAVSQKRQTVLAKLELPHFIETAFMHSWHQDNVTLPGSGNSPP